MADPAGKRRLLCAAVAIAACVVIGKQVGSLVNDGPDQNALARTRSVVSRLPYPVQEPLSKEKLVYLTNSVRAVNGLPGLSGNEKLDAIAEERARDMLQKQYFAHVSPTGEQASDLAQRAGYPYRIIAENIASGLFLSNQKLIDGWMQSPGHRKNILSSDVREIGISVMKGKMMGEDAWVSVQIFGLQSPQVSESSCISPPRQMLDDIEVRRAALKSLEARLRTVKDDLDAEKRAIESEKIAVVRDGRRNPNLSAKIAGYNARSSSYNDSLSEAQAEQAYVVSMIERYNQLVQSYNECRNTQ